MSMSAYVVCLLTDDQCCLSVNIAELSTPPVPIVTRTRYEQSTSMFARIRY